MTSAELHQASSITLLLHGVGDASDKSLRKAVTKGYGASGFGSSWEKMSLPECPALLGRGAEALVLYVRGEAHVMAPLPWARRHIRLSTIAFWSVTLLLVIAALAAFSFQFREPLEELADWLGSWRHRLQAYGMITTFSWMIHIFLGREGTRKFRWPPPWLLAAPVFLVIGAKVFVDHSDWLWIPVAILTGGLCLMAVVVVMRCLQMTVTMRWRIALAAVILALLAPASGVIRYAQLYASAGAHKPAPWVRYPLATAPVKRPVVPAPIIVTPDPPTIERPWKLPPNPLEKTPAEPDPIQKLVEEHRSEFGRNFIAGIEEWRRAGKPLLMEMVKIDEFRHAMMVMGVCLLLSGLVMSFHWILDFALDLLYFVGKAEHRSALVKGTTAVIAWFHEKAPETPLLVVGHSLGSVIAAHALTSSGLAADCLRRTLLVTMGSPLNYVGRVFPQAAQTAQPLSDTLTSAGVRWINLWRSGDVIGKGLELGANGAVQYCLGRGRHSNYWADGNVWRAVARESLASEEAAVRESGATPAPRSLVERSLGVLMVLAIVVLALCGAAIWAAMPYIRRG